MIPSSLSLCGTAHVYRRYGKITADGGGVHNLEALVRLLGFGDISQGSNAGFLDVCA